MHAPTFSSFIIKVSNYGERTGFAFVKAVDDYDNEITDISITPDMFLISERKAFESEKLKYKTKIRVEINSDTIHALRDRATIDGNTHLFHLKIVWGCNRFRLRAKKYIQQNDASHPVIHGIPITKPVFWKKESEYMQTLRDKPFTEEDVKAFTAQINVTTIRVRDNLGSFDSNTERNVILALE
uniref:MSP domain-containing protein n=1 Tax=Panagrellus redivivus TaxID=6233 RepID=A0A7E4ZV64_PANRE